MALDDDQVRYRPAPAVSWTDSGDLVLFESTKGSYHTLNGTASSIWRLLCDGPSVAVLVDTLSGQFAADRDAIASDVRAFVKTAQASGLIVEVA